MPQSCLPIPRPGLRPKWPQSCRARPKEAVSPRTPGRPSRRFGGSESARVGEVSADAGLAAGRGEASD
eukprot:7976107-Alexandrium_andersonii.AAC.1